MLSCLNNGSLYHTGGGADTDENRRKWLVFTKLGDIGPLRGELSPVWPTQLPDKKQKRCAKGEKLCHCDYLNMATNLQQVSMTQKSQSYIGSLICVHANILFTLHIMDSSIKEKADNDCPNQVGDRKPRGEGLNLIANQAIAKVSLNNQTYYP